MTNPNSVPNIVPASKLAKVSADSGSVQTAEPLETETHRLSRTSGDVVINLTINVPAGQLIQLPAPPAMPAPQQRRVLNPDAGLVVSFSVLLFALAVAAFMAYGLRDGWLRPFAVVSTPAPIQVPAPVVRTFGTVDISLVSANDMGIDWFNPVSPGVYQLRQNSSGLFVVENGATILVKDTGTRLFR